MPPDLQRQHTLTDGCSTALGFVCVRVCVHAHLLHIVCVRGFCERNGTDEEKSHAPRSPGQAKVTRSSHTRKQTQGRWLYPQIKRTKWLHLIWSKTSIRFVFLSLFLEQRSDWNGTVTLSALHLLTLVKRIPLVLLRVCFPSKENIGL